MLYSLQHTVYPAHPLQQCSVLQPSALCSFFSSALPAAALLIWKHCRRSSIKNFISSHIHRSIDSYPLSPDFPGGKLLSPFPLLCWGWGCMVMGGHSIDSKYQLCTRAANNDYLLLLLLEISWSRRCHNIVSIGQKGHLKEGLWFKW